MPDLQQYSLPQICGLFDEAMRTIPGYDKYDPSKEVKALIDYEKTKDNYAIKINDCMRHKKDEKNKSRKLRQLLEEKTGRTARKDAVACSIIFTMPEDYEGDPKKFFEAASKALMIAAGIKEDDVLYAVVHMDESQPHIHFAFLPTSYVRDYDMYKAEYDHEKALAKAEGRKEPSRPTILKGEVNRKVLPDEKPVGCNCGRFNKMFLHTLNDILEQRMAEQGVEVHVSKGKGSQFKVQQMTKKQREESLALKKENEQLRAEVEQIKADKEAMASEFKEIQDGYREQIREAKAEAAEAGAKAQEMQSIIEEKEIEISEKAEAISKMQALIRELKLELKRELKHLKEVISNLIKKALTAWKEAKTQAERTEINGRYVVEATEKVKEAAAPLEKLAERAEALLKEEDTVSGIDMATFTRTAQKEGFAKNRIKEAAEKRNEELSDDEIEIALDDWFNLAKYEPILANLSEDKAKAFMKNAERAERALEYTLDIEREDDDYER